MAGDDEFVIPHVYACVCACTQKDRVYVELYAGSRACKEVQVSDAQHTLTGGSALIGFFAISGAAKEGQPSDAPRAPLLTPVRCRVEPLVLHSRVE